MGAGGEAGEAARGGRQGEGEGADEQPAWVREYLSSQKALRFEVRLPEAEEYTPLFKFTGAGESSAAFKQEGGAAGSSKLVFWQGSRGSRIAEQLGFKGFELEDGRVLRLFHASNKRNWRAPPHEPDEPVPAALATLGLSICRRTRCRRSRAGATSRSWCPSRCGCRC